MSTPWRDTGIILIVLLIGGYLGATFAMLRTKTTATRHRVLALLGYSVILGLVIDLIAGPILGGYPDVGSHFWVLWPICAGEPGEGTAARQAR